VLKNTLEKGKREGLDIVAGRDWQRPLRFLRILGLTTALVYFPDGNAART
jgi:hypothetical protein